MGVISLISQHCILGKLHCVTGTKTDRHISCTHEKKNLFSDFFFYTFNTKQKQMFLQTASFNNWFEIFQYPCVFSEQIWQAKLAYDPVQSCLKLIFVKISSSFRLLLLAQFLFPKRSTSRLAHKSSSEFFFLKRGRAHHQNRKWEVSDFWESLIHNLENIPPL